MKIVKVIVRVVAVLLLLAGILYGAYKLFLDPYRGTVSNIEFTVPLSDVLSQEEAEEDIDYVLKLLEERHPASMDGLPEAVAEQGRLEKAELGNGVTAMRLWQAIARILAKLGDAHTSVNVNMEVNERVPVSFRFADGKLYFNDGEYAGSEVVSIGGVAVGELLATYKSQFSYEQEGYAEYYFARMCSWKDDLTFMNANVSDTVEIVFEAPGGEATATFAFENNAPAPEQTVQPPPFVSYEIDAENGIGILTLRSCQYNDIYRETLDDFFTEVKDAAVETVVVDLRGNGGGNSNVANEFIRYLDVDDYYGFGGINSRYGPILYEFEKTLTVNDKIEGLLFTGDVYALTSTQTFSAATDFGVMLSDNGIGKIAGETSGGMPSSYGDILRFQLPNSKLLYTVSFKYFRRPDESKDLLPLVPDYPSSAADALETVYDLKRAR